MTSIPLLNSPTNEPAKITQLYDYLELYSFGEPPAHTLFVLGSQPLREIETVEQFLAQGGDKDQLLLVDPSADAAQRFELEGDVATLYTGTPHATGLPIVETQAGGVAHLKIGEHFLDIYSHVGNNVVHLPALGVLCSGSFGSDVLLPQIEAGSDGSEELETLRLLAQLVKGRRLQILIPRVGSLIDNALDAMKQLAADVAYLHELRRAIPAAMSDAAAAESELLGDVLLLGESLLPANRRSTRAEQIHMQNIETLFHAYQDA